MKQFERSDKHDLYNSDLRPLTLKDRVLSPITLGVTWFGMSVQLGIFLVSASFVQIMTLNQILLALFLGLMLCWGVSILVSDIGIKYGIAFASSIMVSFGYKGSQFGSLLRLIPSVFWVGFNTWIAGMALNEIFKLMFGIQSLIIAMGIIAIVTVLLVFYGAKLVAIFNWFVSPILLIIGVYLLYLLLTMNEVSLIEVLPMGETSGGFKEVAFATMVIAGGWIMVVAGFNDVARECKVSDKADLSSWGKTNNKFAVAQLIGLVPASLLFGFIGAVSAVLTGNGNPVEVITATVGQNSIFIAILCQLFLVLALLSTNSGANVLGSAYILTSIFNKKINLRISAILIVCIALVAQPWKVGESIENAMGIMSSLISPIAGIIIVDYYLIRNRYIDLDHLYWSEGRYAYFKGFNPVAFVAYIIGVIASFFAWDFMLLIGMLVSGLIYFVLAKYWLSPTYPDSVQMVSE
ncbi:MAG TPA: cytosine permease [Pseudogracilibacillus sp.]|nr:cytosine permease [Pseudogracilibacillus sp.]